MLINKKTKNGNPFNPHQVKNYNIYYKLIKKFQNFWSKLEIKLNQLDIQI